MATGRAADRDVDDIGDLALSYAEVKALATGNPLILEKASVDSEVARLGRLRRRTSTTSTAFGAPSTPPSSVREPPVPARRASRPPMQRPRLPEPPRSG